MEHVESNQDTMNVRFEGFSSWRNVRGALNDRPVLFVPTMGALHDGHAALVQWARRDADTLRPHPGELVVSVFVNPTQFNEASDFESYPVTPDEDLALMVKSGADSVVFPSVADIYPTGVPARSAGVDYGTLTSAMEGAARPGHFDGVVDVVRRLFQEVRPTRAYFGEKDWQQLAVIRKLAESEFPGMEIVAVPTVREVDGLAMSSRNVRLTAEWRRRAPMLHQVLCEVARSESPQEACAGGWDKLEAAGFDVEYLCVVDEVSLDGGEKESGAMRAFVAARCGGVRLIDNVPCPQ